MSGAPDLSTVLPILPEIGLLVLAVLVLVLDVTTRRRPQRNYLGWVTAIGLVLIAALATAFSQPGAQPAEIWGGMLRFDSAGFLFRLFFLAGAALTCLFAMESEAIRERGEFYILLLVSTLGMSLMASASDLIMLYLAIETTSIPLYVLAGFVTSDPKSVESGIKYLLFGAMTSAVMLFGFSFLYGFSGSTNLVSIAQGLNVTQVPPFAVATVLVLVLVGFSFKISAVPFHFWAPDVYEGAPSPVAGFLSTASKAAGFAALLRVMFLVFPSLASVWTVLVAILAIASMFIGNLLALAQKNIKRLLAYSSIAQAGYILIGVAADSQLGTTGAIYYLAAYLVTNLAAFGIITVVGRAIGSDEIKDYAGLSRRSPLLALALLVSLLSLGGIPPFAGFFAKLLVFGSAIQQGIQSAAPFGSLMTWLAILGVVNSVIGLYYYLVVLKVVYLYRSDDDSKPLSSVSGWKAALVLCVVGVIALGVILAPVYALAGGAANALGAF
jgi:NADH-quinone oxidoreductase subunit N